MGYRKAETILPPEVVALIQQSVDGDYIYIPRREGKRKSWGETTGCRQETKKRNRMIYLDYRSGTRMDELAEKYFLLSLIHISAIRFPIITGCTFFPVFC